MYDEHGVIVVAIVVDKAVVMVVAPWLKTTIAKPEYTGIKSQVCHSLTVCSWANYSTSLTQFSHLSNGNNNSAYLEGLQ